MKRIMLVVCALFVVLCTAGPVAAQVPFDPTDAGQVKALQSCMNKLQEISGGGETELEEFRPVPNADPRDDDWCWVYQSDSNYDYVYGGCSFGSATGNCVDDCYRAEQECADRARRDCGGTNGDCGTNSTCCENRQDLCRSAFNSCMNSC